MRDKVERNPHIWQNWADVLHRWGVQDFVAELLVITGPLNLLGAQVVYLGLPFLNQVMPAGHVEALAHILENPEETQAFSKFIRQNPATD